MFIIFDLISVYWSLQICYNKNTCLRHSTWQERNEQGQVESSHRCSITKAVLINFAISTGKYLRCSLFLITNFDSPPPVKACPYLVDHLPPLHPCPCRHKAGIIWNIATYEQFTLKGKKTDYSDTGCTHVCSY